MTDINLQSSWPSYQSHRQVYCLHSSARSIHKIRNIHLSSYNWCNLHRSTRSVHNSRKKQFYTLPCLQEQVFLRLFTHCDSCAMLYSHDHAKLHIDHWFHATKARCAICQWFYLLQVPSTDITTGRVTLQENKMVPLTGKAEFANTVLSQASAHSQANAHLQFWQFCGFSRSSMCNRPPC